MQKEQFNRCTGILESNEGKDCTHNVDCDPCNYSGIRSHRWTASSEGMPPRRWETTQPQLFSARSGLTLKASLSSSKKHVRFNMCQQPIGRPLEFEQWPSAHAHFFPLQTAHLKCRYKTQTSFVYLFIIVFHVSEQQLKHSSVGLRLKHVTVLSL